MTTRNAAATRPALLASHVGGLLLLVVPALDMLMPARGTAFATRGDNRRAIADYDAALDLMPRNAEVLFRRGIAKLACQDLTGGNADLRAALQIEPGIDNRLSHLRP